MAKDSKKLPPVKRYFDIRVEVTLPATLHYRVLAETPEQAVDLIKNLSPNSVKHKLAGKRELKVMVYEAGSNLLKFMKNIGR